MSTVNMNNARIELLRACSEGDRTAADSVLAVFPSMADEPLDLSTNENGLCRTARWGHLQIAKALVLSGADVNRPASHAWNPLLIAASEGQTDMVKFFLESGADANFTDRRQNTGLHLAVKWNYALVVALLLRHGCDPNAPNADGDTALHIGVRRGASDSIQLLLKHCDPQIKNRRNLTPIEQEEDSWTGSVQGGSYKQARALVREKVHELSQRSESASQLQEDSTDVSDSVSENEGLNRKSSGTSMKRFGQLMQQKTGRGGEKSDFDVSFSTVQTLLRMYTLVLTRFPGNPDEWTLETLLNNSALDGLKALLPEHNLHDLHTLLRALLAEPPASSSGIPVPAIPLPVCHILESVVGSFVREFGGGARRPNDLRRVDPGYIFGDPPVAYSLRKVIGSGGYGVVFECPVDKRVVIKVPSYIEGSIEAEWLSEARRLVKAACDYVVEVKGYFQGGIAHRAPEFSADYHQPTSPANDASPPQSVPDHDIVYSGHSSNRFRIDNVPWVLMRRYISLETVLRAGFLRCQHTVPRTDPPAGTEEQNAPVAPGMHLWLEGRRHPALCMDCSVCRAKLKILVCLCRGLYALHDTFGMWHLDVKCDNVFVDTGNNDCAWESMGSDSAESFLAKVLTVRYGDFGLSRENVEGTRVYAGNTPVRVYKMTMPPELLPEELLQLGMHNGVVSAEQKYINRDHAEGEIAYNFGRDIFALGLVMAQVICGDSLDALNPAAEALLLPLCIQPNVLTALLERCREWEPVLGNVVAEMLVWNYRLRPTAGEVLWKVTCATAWRSSKSSTS